MPPATLPPLPSSPASPPFLRRRYSPRRSIAADPRLRSMDRSHWLNSFEFLDKLAERLVERMTAGETSAGTTAGWCACVASSTGCLPPPLPPQSEVDRFAEPVHWSRAASVPRIARSHPQWPRAPAQTTQARHAMPHDRLPASVRPPMQRPARQSTKHVSWSSKQWSACRRPHPPPQEAGRRAVPAHWFLGREARPKRAGQAPRGSKRAARH